MVFGALSSQASTTPPPKFKQPHYFARTSGQGGWYCTICTTPHRAHLESMDGNAAKLHERTREHTRKVEKYESLSFQPDYSGWEIEHTPFADLRTWEKQGRVDRLRDFVPFWRDGVLAAERGEETVRMEEFLEKLEEQWQDSQGWGKAANDGWGPDIGAELWGGGAGDWGEPTPAWGAPRPKCEDLEWGPGEGDWGVSSSKTASEKDEQSAHRPQRRGTTAQSSPRGKPIVSGDSRAFIEKVARKEAASVEQTERMLQFFEMSTQEKVHKIEEMIRFLHNHS